MREDPVLDHGKTFYNKPLFYFIPLGKFSTEFMVIGFADGQQGSVGKGLDIPAVGLVEKEAADFRDQEIFSGDPLRDLFAIR